MHNRKNKKKKKQNKKAGLVESFLYKIVNNIQKIILR